MGKWGEVIRMFQLRPLGFGSLMAAAYLY